MSIEALEKALSVIGSKTAMAKVCQKPHRRLTQAHVTKWLKSPNPDQMPPAEYCPDIERATRGEVRCEELRPDVDWAVLRGKPIDEAAHDERRSTDHEMQEAA